MSTKFPATVMVFGVVMGSEGHIMTPQFPPQGLRVNADADAHVETLQTTVVKPPLIDSVANGGKPYVFQQDSPPSHKAPKIQGWMAENFNIMPHHTYGRFLTTH
ncbi:hypothetical protein ACTXT7_003000 [Hymenolepis weldensis]